MFTSLMNFFADVWDGWKAIFQSVWSYIRGGYVWLVGIFLAVVAAVTGLITWITDALNHLTSLVGSIVMPSAEVSQSVGDLLSIANYVFPVSETFTITVAVCGLWLVMLTIRFAKWVREVLLP